MVASWSFAAVAYIESDILGPGSHRGFLQGDSAVMVRPKMTPLCQTAVSRITWCGWCPTDPPQPSSATISEGRFGQGFLPLRWILDLLQLVIMQELLFCMSDT